MTQLPVDPITRLERDALMLMLQYPAAIGGELALRVSRARFSNTTLALVRDAIASSMDAFETPNWVERVVEEAPDDFAGLVHQLAMAPIPQRAGRELAGYGRGLAVSVISRDLLASKAELLGQLQRASSAAEPERYQELQRQLMQVEAERRALVID